MAENDNDPRMNVAFQGELGAYSHLACCEGLPDYTPLPCRTFEDAFAAVDEGRAGRAMIPIENSLAGRVADIHHLIPTSEQYIVAEHFQAVNHQLMAIKGAKIGDIREVHSHIHALPQCRKLIKELGIEPVVHADTAGACQMIAEKGDKTMAAIGSPLAAQIYDLQILRKNVQDLNNNVTRFIVLARERITPHPKDGDAMTTMVFQVRSVPASLYKTLGGFATANINITKLESYIEPGSFEQAQFYADFEGHPEDQRVAWALEEAQFFCTRLQILGTYPRNPFRNDPRVDYEAPHVKG
ncbi:MAG: prephenate dehydratase [Rhodospirillaceae bacterium]|jgi:prephenate dehydratase|nr:prephenate dehydratase [Rhodospirillaceae bacterium]MBT4689121.1 prephenate dehydratase [Rhodospirillaceae bacterium]MBT5079724.1 prephenate dehydratase [Rhodospirillaceae bacterium]MBT5527285.1 prephenate dehydratase [Rhodospirillaceae bacterium]MBT5880324.1 prephenate dehydratase [Rhodospirillaceae bacterium]